MFNHSVRQCLKKSLKYYQEKNMAQLKKDRQFWLEERAGGGVGGGPTLLVGLENSGVTSAFNYVETSATVYERV